ncbi:MAG: fibronectin type III domain-containing protein [Bdellovibrionota bacterium]
MKTKVYVSVVVVLIILASFFIFQEQILSSFKAKSEITLEWDMNTGPHAGYKIYYGTESNKYLQAKGYGIDVGLTATPNQPKHTIKDLEVGKTYYFAVTTYDSSRTESDFSGEVSKAVK